MSAPPSAPGPHAWGARAPIGPPAPRTPEIRPAEPRPRPSLANAAPAPISTILPDTGRPRPAIPDLRPEARGDGRGDAPGRPEARGDARGDARTEGRGDARGRQSKPPALPPRGFDSPAAAWAALIKESGRPLLEDAAFLGAADGFIHLAIRRESSRFRVEGSLLGLDLRPWFPYCQGAKITVDGDIGETGWERRSARDRERKEAALAAAQESEAIRLLSEGIGAILVVPDIEAPDLPDEQQVEEE